MNNKQPFLFLSALLIFLLLSVCLHAQGVKVACIGNSVTYGYGLGNREQESYPAKLQGLLGNNYTVRNFGHSGATLLKKGHNPYYKTKEFSEAINFTPDIAIIHLGLNDTDPRDWPDYRLNFEADYAWLIDTLKKANPAVKIYLCRLTPIFSGHPRFKSGTRDWYWQIQALLPGIAQANKVKLIDLLSPLYNRPDLFADNLHPDKEGAAIIANTIYQSISQNFGGLKLPEVFADNMVLQRQRSIPVYGMANGEDNIEVTFNGHKLIAKTNQDGHWKVLFPAMQAGGPYQMAIRSNGAAITLKNILIGDVWLCSGQSNMAFPLKRSAGGSEELKGTAVNNSKLRLYQLSVLKETDPIMWDTATLRKVNQLKYFSGTWKESSQLSAAEFSAVAYYFGKQLNNKEHVPIGLIQVAVGGSPIESWIDRYTMEHDDLLVDMLNNWRNSDYMMKWCRDRADTNLKYTSFIKQRHPYEPCYNYEAGISALTTLPIKGVIWYQGESNAHNPELYEHLFKTLVSSWRQKWEDNFPFYFVQLSGIDRPSWPVFRDMARKLAKQIPNCEMAVSMDLGDSLNVHYLNKKPLGERLALLAEKYTYKRNIKAKCAEPLSAKQNKQEILIRFPADEQLATINNKPLTGFEIVTDKGIRISAKAIIKNNIITIHFSTDEPIRVIYYAMQPYTHANLINRAGLPASTFIMYRHKDIFY